MVPEAEEAEDVVVEVEATSDTGPDVPTRDHDLQGAVQQGRLIRGLLREPHPGVEEAAVAATGGEILHRGEEVVEVVEVDGAQAIARTTAIAIVVEVEAGVEVHHGDRELEPSPPCGSAARGNQSFKDKLIELCFDAVHV